MKIVGMAVIGPNEKYLENTLKEFKRLCDDVMICMNNIDEKSRELIAQYGFWYHEDNREWGIEQPNIKTDLLKKVEKLNPDWIVALDADEVFAPEVTREVLEGLSSGTEIAWYFMIVNLYNDKEHFAHDVGIQRFWNIRYFKLMPALGLQYLRKNLHCGLAPPYAYKFGWHAPYYIEHYGLMLKEDRDRKAQRYNKYDPSAKFKSKDYYDALITEQKVYSFDRQGLLNKLKEAPDTQKRKTPKYQ